MSHPPVKFGIVGLGRMGQNHVRVLSLLKGVEICCVHDADAAVTARAAAQYGARAAATLDDMLADIDALVIASPTVTHADYFERAATKVRNIFVEKPVADTLEGARLVERLATEGGLNVQVGFIERFNPAVTQLKGVIDRADNVFNVDFTRTNRISARITDVDVILDLMIHDIDLALYLNGPVASVAASGVVTEGMIEFASATLTHGNGRFSRIMASRVTDKKMRKIEATCSDMYVDCDLLRKEIRLSRQSTVAQPLGQPYIISALSETIEVPPQEALSLELQAFVRSCNDPESANAPGPAEGREAMEICWRIRDAIHHAGRARSGDQVDRPQ